MFDEWTKRAHERFDIISDASKFLDEKRLGNISLWELSEDIVKKLKDDEFKRALLEVIYDYLE